MSLETVSESACPYLREVLFMITGLLPNAVVVTILNGKDGPVITVCSGMIRPAVRPIGR